MKRSLFLTFALLLLCLPAFAQPSLITVTGTIYRADGTTCGGCTITISKARTSTSTLGQPARTVTADNSGAISFTAVQGSFATITGTFVRGKYNFTQGVELFFPTQSSISFDSLLSGEDALLAILPTTYASVSEPYITKTPSSGLSNEFALSTLATGILKNTTTTGVPTIAAAGTDYVAPGAASASGLTMASSRLLGRTTASSGAIEEITIGSGLSLSAGTLSATGGGGGTWGSIAGTLSNQTDLQTALNAKANTSSLAAIATSGSASDLIAGTVPLARLSGITDTQISGSAAITYSKLNLTGAILNADLAGSIANAKLANSTITIQGSAVSLGGSALSTTSTPTFNSVSLGGTAGAGYLEIVNQSLAPGTPTSAGRLYFDTSNRLSWKGTNGFTRTFDGTANTADRIYVLPDAAGTVVLNDNTATLSNKTISGASNTLSNIGNASLTNSAITIAGTSTSLGGSITLDTITGLASTGLVKRSGANTFAIATSGTDYAPATSGSSILKGNGSGGFSNATQGTDYSNNNPSPAFSTLTDSATITWAFASPQLVSNATVTLGGNRTLSITGVSAGATGVLKVVQDGTGSRTLTLPAGSKVINGGGGVVSLSTAAGAIDILAFVYDGTNYFWVVGTNYN